MKGQMLRLLGSYNGPGYTDEISEGWNYMFTGVIWRSDSNFPELPVHRVVNVKISTLYMGLLCTASKHFQTEQFFCLLCNSKQLDCVSFVFMLCMFFPNVEKLVHF